MLRLEHCQDMDAVSVRSAVSHCRHLRDLQLIRCTETGPQFWRELRHCSALQSLEVEGCHVGDAGLAAIADVAGLTHLGLASCGGVTARCLVGCLRKQPQLESLDLSGTRVGGMADMFNLLMVIGEMENLKHLVLDRMGLADTHVALLLPLGPRLERLSLQANEELTDASLQVISTMKALTVRRRHQEAPVQSALADCCGRFNPS